MREFSPPTDPRATLPERTSSTNDLLKTIAPSVTLRRCVVLGAFLLALSFRPSLEAASAPDPLVIKISNRGVSVDGKSVSMDRLQRLVRTATLASRPIALRADKQTRYSKVMEVLDAIGEHRTGTDDPGPGYREQLRQFSR